VDERTQPVSVGQAAAAFRPEHEMAQAKATQLTAGGAGVCRWDS